MVKGLDLPKGPKGNRAVGYWLGRTIWKLMMDLIPHGSDTWAPLT